MSHQKIKKCPICKESFAAKRVDKIACGKRCSTILSSRKKRQREKIINKSTTGVHRNTTNRWLRDVEEANPNFQEVKKLIYSIKEKHFYADMLDLLKIVHLYDLTHPRLENIPHRRDIEKSCEVMFLQLCLWYKNTLEKKEKLNELGL